MPRNSEADEALFSVRTGRRAVMPRLSAMAFAVAALIALPGLGHAAAAQAKSDASAMSTGLRRARRAGTITGAATAPPPASPCGLHIGMAGVITRRMVRIRLISPPTADPTSFPERRNLPQASGTTASAPRLMGLAISRILRSDLKVAALATVPAIIIFCRLSAAFCPICRQPLAVSRVVIHGGVSELEDEPCVIC